MPERFPSVPTLGLDHLMIEAGYECRQTANTSKIGDKGAALTLVRLEWFALA